MAPRTDSAETRDYSAVSGPSFLGLDPAASSEPTPGYLLEDDEPSGHGRLFVGIVLLLAVGGGLFWQWQHEGYPWNPAPKQTASSISGDAAETPQPAEAAQPAPPAVKPDETSSTEQKTEPPPAAAAKDDKPDEKQDEKSDDGDAQAQVPAQEKPEPKPAKATATPPVAKPKRDARQPVAADDLADEADPSEDLFIVGQKYLYGNGVPEDCGRARTKLMAAANQSNLKAQSTVATMYATGHCLPRNLPSAYHWFALALHQDRDNTRLQRDLEMIWGQMTEEEKQIALKSR